MSIFFCKNGVWQIYDVCRYPNIYYRTIFFVSNYTFLVNYCIINHMRRE